MKQDLQSIAFSKAIMLAILLWVASSLPIIHYKLYDMGSMKVVYGIILVLGALLLFLVPLIYLSFWIYHRCPRCKSSWSYSYDKDIVLEKGSKINEKGEEVCFEKILNKHSCKKCNYQNLKTKFKILKEVE